MSKSKVIVTGGSGFLGKAVNKVLKEFSVECFFLYSNFLSFLYSDSVQGQQNTHLDIIKYTVVSSFVLLYSVKAKPFLYQHRKKNKLWKLHINGYNLLLPKMLHIAKQVKFDHGFVFTISECRANVCYVSLRLSFLQQNPLFIIFGNEIARNVFLL